jgi:hypothetical protein
VGNSLRFSAICAGTARLRVGDRKFPEYSQDEAAGFVHAVRRPRFWRDLLDDLPRLLERT